MTKILTVIPQLRTGELVLGDSQGVTSDSGSTWPTTATDKSKQLATTRSVELALETVSPTTFVSPEGYGSMSRPPMSSFDVITQTARPYMGAVCVELLLARMASNHLNYTPNYNNSAYFHFKKTPQVSTTSLEAIISCLPTNATQTNFYTYKNATGVASVMYTPTVGGMSLVSNSSQPLLTFLCLADMNPPMVWQLPITWSSFFNGHSELPNHPSDMTTGFNNLVRNCGSYTNATLFFPTTDSHFKFMCWQAPAEYPNPLGFFPPSIVYHGNWSWSVLYSCGVVTNAGVSYCYALYYNAYQSSTLTNTVGLGATDFAQTIPCYLY